MRTLSVILLIGLVGLLAFGLSAAENLTKGIQPAYRVHVTGDTVWFWGKTFKQPIAFSKFTPSDSTNGLTFEGDFDTLWISGSLDTTVVLPTTESIRFWFCSDRDSMLQTWSCSVLKPDTAKIGLLRDYRKFGTANAPMDISFSYTAPSDSELTKLRTRYNLDSVAGTGDEFSRMTSLLQWTQHHLLHDGVSVLPEPKPFTTLHMLEMAATEKRGFNCYLVAFAMNDIFLSMGFKSRQICCMPYDTTDHECHQVNMVWSNQWRKWILMDPSFDTWYTDTAGTPLNPWEVREALANGDSLRLPDCINHNGETRLKGEQCRYMSKNLFLLKSTASRRDETGSLKRNVEVWLIPAGYNGHRLGQLAADSTGSWYSYFTDNADWFFAPPLAEPVKGSPRTYRIYTDDDTVWVRMEGQLKPTFIVSKMENPYNGNIKFDNMHDTLMLFAGNDTAVILPTSETIGFWIFSAKDTVKGILNCSIATAGIAFVDTGMVQLLRRFSEFGQILPAGGAKFSYALASDSSLVKLRATFHLDSVAGTGDEFSRQRNLLRWVHQRIRHDGNSTNPKPANAEHIIQVCDQEKRGVNCRMMATTLNEVYLAMGFRSRHLTCLPYDTLDQDCHVIDMVWSTQYSKWLYMDPTYDAYWMDTNRIPLSPWQVRQAIVTGDSIVVSDSINWNGEAYGRSDYYNYMAKNLFRLSCPTESAFGYESRDTVDHIALEPSLYNPRLLGKAVQTRAGTRTDYCTDDADWFFAPPK